MNAGKKIVVQRWRKECRDKVKSKVHTLDIAPLRETPPQKCSTQVLNVFSRDLSFTCTPTRSSAVRMSHTCLCLR